MNAKRITSLGISLAGGDQLQPEVSDPWETVRLCHCGLAELRHGSVAVQHAAACACGTGAPFSHPCPANPTQSIHT